MIFASVVKTNGEMSSNEDRRLEDLRSHRSNINQKIFWSFSLGLLKNVSASSKLKFSPEKFLPRIWDLILEIGAPAIGRFFFFLEMADFGWGLDMHGPLTPCRFTRYSCGKNINFAPTNSRWRYVNLWTAAWARFEVTLPGFKFL